MKATLLMATCVVLTLSVALSHADPIAWDSFATTAGGNDYAVGPIQYQNPTVGLGGFTGAWSGGTNAFCAQHGGLSHPLTPAPTHDGLLIAYTDDNGWANRRLNRAIDYSPSDGTYYMSVLLQKNQQQNIDLLVGLAPSESYSWSFSTIQGTYVGIQDGNISFLTTNHLYSIVPDTQVNVGETYFALMQFDYNTSGPDTITATIYDGSSTEVGSYEKSNLDLDGDIGRLGVITSDFSPNVAVDEWRFGTELSDVMVPEPSTIPGDANCDDAVDVIDLGILATNYGATSGAEWADGDFSGDGAVNVSDLGILATHYGESATVAGVPEPSTLTLLATCGLALLGLGVRRRKR